MTIPLWLFILMCSAILSGARLVYIKASKDEHYGPIASVFVFIVSFILLPFAPIFLFFRKD